MSGNKLTANEALSLSLFLQPSNPNECIYRSDNRKKKREVVPRKGCLSKDKRKKESVGNWIEILVHFEMLSLKSR